MTLQVPYPLAIPALQEALLTLSPSQGMALPASRSSRRFQPAPGPFPGLCPSPAAAPEAAGGGPAVGAERWRRGACSQPGRAAERRRERRAPWKRAEAGKERQEEEDAEPRAALAARARVPG